MTEPLIVPSWPAAAIKAVERYVSAGSQTVLTASKHLTSAQILALHDTPINFGIATPDAGTMIALVGAPVAQLFFGTTPYDQHSTDLLVAPAAAVATEDGLGYMWDNVLQQTEDSIGIAKYESETPRPVARYAGSPLVIYHQVENPTGGDGSVTIYISYRVVTLA